MVTEVVDGVYDLELTVTGDGGTRVFHPVAIETARGVVLVDVGLPGQAEDVRAALADVGYDPGDVSAILFTHQDGDHAGAGSALREEADAVTMAHGNDAPAIDGRETPVKSGDDRYPPVGVDVELVAGVTLAAADGRFEVVETPGHTPGHVSLYDPERRFLLAGDALTAADGQVRPPVPKFTPDPERAAESVRRLAEYDVESVLCFHGGYAETSSEEIAGLADRV